MPEHTQIVTLIDKGTGLLINLNLQDYRGPEFLIPGATIQWEGDILPEGNYRIDGKPHTIIADGAVILVRYIIEKV